MEIITIPEALKPNGSRVTITKTIASVKSKPKCPKRCDTILA